MLLELRFFTTEDKPKRIGAFNSETMPSLGDVVQLYGKDYQVQYKAWVFNEKDNYIYLGVVSLEIDESEEECPQE